MCGGTRAREYVSGLGNQQYEQVRKVIEPPPKFDLAREKEIEEEKR